MQPNQAMMIRSIKPINHDEIPSIAKNIPKSTLQPTAKTRNAIAAMITFIINPITGQIVKISPIRNNMSDILRKKARLAR